MAEVAVFAQPRGWNQRTSLPMTRMTSKDWIVLFILGNKDWIVDTSIGRRCNICFQARQLIVPGELILARRP